MLSNLLHRNWDTSIFAVFTAFGRPIGSVRLDLDGLHDRFLAQTVILLRVTDVIGQVSRTLL